MELNAVKLKEGFDQYNSPRQQGDIDLVALVREALIGYNVGESALIAYDNNPLIMEASNKQSHIQRWLMNRYWVCQLSSLDIPTIDTRLYLIQNGTAEDWIRLFGQYVLPFAIQNGLPKQING